MTKDKAKTLFCDDAISREAVIYYIKGHIHEIITESGTDKNAHTNSILRALINGVETMPSVTQKPNMTWVTGADGAKIAFKDVPVWKVTKICEILGEPQESDIETRKPCINYEDGCEEWDGCPCVYYKAESEEQTE